MDNNQEQKINKIEKMIINSMSILFGAIILIVFICWIEKANRTNIRFDDLVIYFGTISLNTLMYLISTNITKLIAIIAKNTCKGNK